MKGIKIKELLINVKTNETEEGTVIEKTYKENEITMDNNYLFEIYSIYKGKKIEEVSENIIKVNLPSDLEKAKDLLKEGFKFENIEYVSLLTTTGLMKHEDTDLNIKCDYFFINKNDEDFKEKLENVASCGKLKTLKGKKICINKDIVSRLSLLLSSGDIVCFEKDLKFAILPEMEFTYINNYLQFSEKIVKDEDGKEIRVIDKDNLRLEKHPNLKVKHTAMDGSGFMMPDIAEEITKQLNKKYMINWVGFRTLGNAGKGLLVKFDWKQYFREERGLNSLIVKDMWGNDVDLFEADIVVNESVIKWAKLFKGYDEMIQAREDFKEYNSLFNSLCITTKFYKEEPKEYSLTNYQLLSNLNLTPKELRELAIEDIEAYSKAVVDRNIDIIRIMLGDWACDEKELENKRFTPSTKIHQALQIDEKLINCETAKFTIEKMINKKIHQLAGGRITVKGNYKVIIKDVFSYFDSLIDPNNYNIEDGKIKVIGCISKNGLNKKTNYVPRERGYRTLARCPLNSATEIIKTELVENKMYDKYFGDFSKDIIFYAFDDNMMLQSGADEDTDISLVIDNETIYNSVIEDIDKSGIQWCFRNQFDGKANKRKYTDDEMYDSILNTAGNSIGMLSNLGAKISNKVQESCMINLDGGLINANVLYEAWKDARKEDYKKAYKEEDLEKRRELYKNLKNMFLERMKERYLENGYKTEPTENDYKKYMLKNFQNYKKYSYYTLYLQMVAIDSVKTNIKVDKDMLKPLKILELNKKKKPLYIYHAKFKEENKVIEYGEVQYNDSLLNNFSKEVISTIGYNARNIKSYSNTHLFTILKNLEEKGVILNYELLNDIKNIYESYMKESKLIKSKVEMLKEEKEKLTDIQEIERMNNKIILEKEIRNNELLELEVKIYDKINIEIKAKYSNLEILLALGKYRDDDKHRIKSKFIFDFFFEELKEVLIENAKGVMTIYVLNNENEDDKIHFLYKDYIKENKEIPGVNLSQSDILKKKVKLNKVIETRFGGLTQTDLKNKEIEIKLGQFKNKKGEAEEQVQVLIDEEMIGYIFNNRAGFAKIGNTYRIIEINPDNSKKTATVYLEMI